jgi:hypothetical protein
MPAPETLTHHSRRIADGITRGETIHSGRLRRQCRRNRRIIGPRLIPPITCDYNTRGDAVCRNIEQAPMLLPQPIRVERARQARAHIEKNFALTEALKHYSDLYESLMAPGR